MGTIVSNFFISLDGVVQAPNEWHFPGAGFGGQGPQAVRAGASRRQASRSTGAPGAATSCTQT